MFKLMGKKIIASLHKLFLLNWPYGVHVSISVHGEQVVYTVCKSVNMDSPCG